MGDLHQKLICVQTELAQAKRQIQELRNQRDAALRSKLEMEQVITMGRNLDDLTAERNEALRREKVALELLGKRADERDAAVARAERAEALLKEAQ